MEQIKYESGELVKLGDLVEVKRFFRKITGTVTSVYDPSMPSPLKGDNEYGVGIQISDEKFLWGLPHKSTKLIRRSDN